MSESGSTFRAPSAPAPAAPSAPSDTTTTASGAKDDQLLFTYQDEHKHPYTADYFNLSEFWNEKDGQSPEAIKIEDYLKDLVSDKQLENSTNAAREYIKDMERKAGIDKTERTVMKLTKLAAYVDFLRTVNNAKKEQNKWV